MICKLCGFTASEIPKHRAGSMALHAKMKHKVDDASTIFEERADAPPPAAAGGNKKPTGGRRLPAQKKKGQGGTWRLLDPTKPMERAAIAGGFTKICVVQGVDPTEWDIA